MPAVSVEPGYVTFVGQSIPLLSGEFHYWRNEPQYWPTILKRLKQAGFTLVTSFVQWNVHETSPGVFDFEGRTAPQRSLPAFLKCAQEAGLYVHLRPGPACCEWRNSGGTSFGTPWRQCYEAYWRVVAPFSITQGGPLLLQQIHNEWFDPIGSYDILVDLFRDFDGFHATDVPYWIELCGPNCHYLSSGYDFNLKYLSLFLKFRYSSVDRFQSAWGPEYGSFEQPVTELINRGITHPHCLFKDLTKRFENIRFPGQRIRPLFDILDWFRCYTAIPLSEDMDYARQLGCDLPLTHNWAMMETGEWDRLAHTDLSGYDHYMPVSVPVWDWIFITADFHGSRFPFVGEFMTGTIERYMWGGQGITDERWERFSKLSFLANGARGLNLYMFVERDNWLQCPVDERGGLRPTYESFQRIFTALRDREWHRRSIAHDVGIVKYLPYHQARSHVPESHFDRGYNLPWIKENIYGRRDPKLEFHRLFKSLHEANIDFINHKCPHHVESVPDLPVLICYSLRFMGRDLAEALVRYVRNGGKLLLYPEVPERDLDGAELNILKDTFHLRAVETVECNSIASGKTSFTFSEKQRVTVLEENDDASVLLRTPEGQPCAVLNSIGQGKVLFAGGEIGASEALVDYLIQGCLGARKFALTDASESGAGVAVHPEGEPLLVVYNGHKTETVHSVILDPSILPTGPTLYLEDLVTQTDPVAFVRPAQGPATVQIQIPPRDATIFAITAKRPAPPVRFQPSVVHKLTQALRRSEDFSYYINRYASGASHESWPVVQGKDWTLPAIANGNTYGVQGWFWLVQTVEIPNTLDRVFLRLMPRGWHNLIVLYVNGMEMGRAYVERPGNAMEYDITSAVRPGAANTIALRLFRQSLDCHDKGGSGFDAVEVATGSWKTAIAEWHHTQERLDRGEHESWNKGTISSPDWTELKLPFTEVLFRSRSVEWLYFPFEAQTSKSCRIHLEGSNLAARIWLNGQYVVKTPYLPVELPCDVGLNEGTNHLVLCLVPDPFSTYDAPRERRYQDYILDGLKPLEVSLNALILKAFSQ